MKAVKTIHELLNFYKIAIFYILQVRSQLKHKTARNKKKQKTKAEDQQNCRPSGLE